MGAFSGVRERVAFDLQAVAAGARAASGSLLLVVHSDTAVPLGFDERAPIPASSESPDENRERERERLRLSEEIGGS